MFLAGWSLGASACIVGVGVSAGQTRPLASLFQIFVSFNCDTGARRAGRPSAPRGPNLLHQGLGHPTSTVPVEPNRKNCWPHVFPC